MLKEYVGGKKKIQASKPQNQEGPIYRLAFYELHLIILIIIDYKFTTKSYESSSTHILDLITSWFSITKSTNKGDI